MKPRCQKRVRVCSNAIEFTVAWSSINGIEVNDVNPSRCQPLNVIFIDAHRNDGYRRCSYRIGRINVKSWNAFQSSHWFAAIPDCHLPQYQIRAIFGIVMRLHRFPHTGPACCWWKNAKMPLNYVRLNADCTLSRANRIAAKTIWRLLTSVLFTFDDIARIKTKMCVWLRMENTNEHETNWKRTIVVDKDRLNCVDWKMKID